MSSIILPTIHRNGTSAQTLFKGNLAAHNAILDALKIVGEVEFNNRDYYPVAGSWEAAGAQHLAVSMSLIAAAKHFYEIAEHASERL